MHYICKKTGLRISTFAPAVCCPAEDDEPVAMQYSAPDGALYYGDMAGLMIAGQSRFRSPSRNIAPAQTITGMAGRFIFYKTEKEMSTYLPNHNTRVRP